MYRVSSVPLIYWQPDKVCWVTFDNNQTRYNKVGIYISSLTCGITRHTTGGFFFRTRWQTLFLCIHTLNRGGKFPWISMGMRLISHVCNDYFLCWTTGLLCSLSLYELWLKNVLDYLNLIYRIWDGWVGLYPFTCLAEHTVAPVTCLYNFPCFYWFIKVYLFSCFVLL